MRTVSKQSSAKSFSGEASFAKSDDYIDSLAALQVGSSAYLGALFPHSVGDAKAFSEAASVIAQAEDLFQASTGSIATQPLWRLPLFARGSDPQKLHPLNWLSVAERKTNDEKRTSHNWYVTLEDDGLWLTFEHGQFGYRREPHDRWSSALARLGKLLAGRCSWLQFGDLESRNTLLGKGQFYWQDPKTQTSVPVDNFVFATRDGRELTLAGVGHRCVLNFLVEGQEPAVEWYANYAEGLQRLADVLEGAVVRADFGQEPNPELYANAGGRRSATDPSSRALLPLGQFVVKCIYASNDVFPAPVLAYKTKEGRQVVLTVGDISWTVRVCNTHNQWKSQQFDQAQASEALRTTARVLNGTLLWRDFGAHCPRAQRRVDRVGGATVPG